MAAKKSSKKVKSKKVMKTKTVKKAKKAVVKARSVATAKARPIVARKIPETLRLTSFTPSLTVNDLAKSLAFYADGLGFLVGERWQGDDGVLRGVMLKAGACELGISQDDWKLGKNRVKGVGSRIFLETSQDIDATAARLKRAGYTLTAEPADNPQWGVRSFSVDDPDGFHLTISRDL
ncbi:MAG: VOC family protein [Vicinamibacteria bacterium]